MEPEKKSNGAFIGLIVIIVILIIGGIYIWMQNKEAVKLQNSQAQSENVANQDAAALNTLELESQSTDVDAGVDANAVY